MGPIKIVGVFFAILVALACYIVGRVIEAHGDTGDRRFFSAMAYIGIPLWLMLALAIFTW